MSGTAETPPICEDEEEQRDVAETALEFVRRFT